MTDTNIWKRASKAAYTDVYNRKEEPKPLPKPRSISQVAGERLAEKVMEAYAPKTGYPDLDGIIKGFIPGHLYTVTGVENVGKTSLACNFSVRVAKQKKKVLYFALEPENTVVDYLASVRFNKEFNDLTTDDLEYDDGFIHVYGKQEISKVDDLARIIEELPKYDLVIIDHIGYFITSQQNWLQEQSNTIKRLAGLAKAKKCAIVMIAHLRKRSTAQKRDYTPSSDDIAGSGSFKQDSTEVMIVTRDLIDPKSPDPEYSNQGWLYVTKTKCGPNGKIRITFQNFKANITTDGEQAQLMGENSIRYTQDTIYIGDEAKDQEMEDNF